ncbi:MAG: response regulator [Oligoflexia bacterium]|nr:response regulator [Oligoflexia bacterium]
MSDKTKILIIDDEVEILEFLVDCLEDEDFAVTSFENAQEAYQAVKAGEKFDIVMSDFHMKGLDGLSLLKKFNEEGLVDFKFYLCTGDMEYSDKDIIKLNGTGVIAKPYMLDDVIELLKK